MDGVGHEFFTRAGLAENEYASVGWRHQADLLAQGLHRNAVADDDALGDQLFFQVDIFAAKLFRLDRILDQDESFVERERLFQKVVSPELGGADRGLDGSVAGDHDDFRRVVEFANAREGLEAVDASHPDIQQDYVEGSFAEQIEAGFAAFDRGGRVAFVDKNSGKGLADSGFVIDHENLMRDVMHVERLVAPGPVRELPAVQR